MKRKTSNVAFYCRESKKTKSGFSPIELCLTIDGDRKVVCLPRKEKPEDFWNAVNLKKKSHPIKDYLDAVRTKLNNIQTELINDGLPVTTKNVLNYFFGENTDYLVKDLFDDFFKILDKRVGVDLTKKTYKKYERTRDRFKDVIDFNRPVSDINDATIQTYMANLRADYDFQTITGYASRLKSVMLFGLKNKKLKNDPFKYITIERKSKDAEFLTEDELMMIENTTYSRQCVQQAAELFIFQAGSGVAYEDLVNLVPDDFQLTENGKYFIHKQRMKTGVYYTSVLLPDAQKIAEKHEFALPRISNQRYNTNLKDVGIESGLNRKLHSHMGRHTYATRCLSHSVSITSVSKMLGHTQLRQTLHYAKVLQGTILNEVSDAFNKIGAGTPAPDIDEQSSSKSSGSEIHRQ